MARVSTPPTMGTNNYESSVTLRLNDWLVDRIDEMRVEMPKKNGKPTSRSEVIRVLVEQAIEEHWSGSTDEG